MLFISIILSINSEAQNVLEKKISANGIETITINGNQIFTISISTSKTDDIIITSTLDGEYQNLFQVNTTQKETNLILSLEQMAFTDIPDDKRNAHKVIAATLYLEIPEQLSINLLSDIGSVALNGNFNALSIELLQGHCEVIGNVTSAIINTIDGDISVETDSATINAKSNHGNVNLDEFSNSESSWTLQSINGNITVAKQ